MTIFKCKMCGGTIEFKKGDTVGTCDSCGTLQTLPKLDDEQRANLYDRANHFRRNNDFDKASGIYEKILSEDKTDAEAYWSLVLCRYGIEYVEDPTSHKRVPTVNRAQFTSIYADEDYKSAIEYSDSYQKTIYEDEAKAIDEIQKGILAISQKEEPFDVFICYKETDNNGRRTMDSVLANDLYHQLVQEGYKVFFSRITLEDKLGTAYEPYIFAALNSAKVMVVLGTRPEYFNAVWVKNEWSRYLTLVQQSNGKKVLIPAYKDMDPYDLPEEFSHLQAQDMSKLGFMQDLIRGIKKITNQNEKTTKVEMVTKVVDTNITPLLIRVSIFLQDKEWDHANEYCERVLDMDPENGEAYFYKLMADLNVSDDKELKNYCGKAEKPLSKNKNYNKVLKFGDDSLVEKAKDYNEITENHIAFENVKQKMNSAKTPKEYRQVAELFSQLNQKDWAEKCLNEAETSEKDIYSIAKQRMNIATEESEFEKVSTLFLNISEYKDSENLAGICLQKAEECRNEQLKKEKEEQQKIIKLAKSVEFTLTNIENFKKLDKTKKKYKELENFKKTFLKTLSEIEELDLATKNLEDTIHSLEEKKNHLGIFAFSEKKAIEEQIEAKKKVLTSNASNIESKINSMNGYTSEEQLNSAIELLENNISTLEKKFDGVEYLDVDQAIGIFRENKDIQEAVLKSNGNLRRFTYVIEDGKTFLFGKYNGEEIKWRVLKKENNKALLISEKILCEREYNEKLVAVTWRTCSLRSWLNNDFYSSTFDAFEQNDILNTKINETTEDKIFLLSVDEAKKYFKNDNDRMSNSWYWLRTSGTRGDSCAAYVSYNGSIREYGRDVSISLGVRPALWINLES